MVGLAGLVLWLLAVWPLFVVQYLPHEDLPGHVAGAYVVNHISAFPEYVAAHGFRTNSAFLHWVCAMAGWLGYMGAARVFLAAVLAITAFGYAFLLDASGGERPVGRVWIGSLFAAPLVHHWFVLMGMLNFSLSFGLCVWILGLLAYQRTRWSHARAVGIAAISILAWFAHSFPLVIVAAIVIADLAHAYLRARTATPAAARAAVAVAPAVAMVALGALLTPVQEFAHAHIPGAQNTTWFGLPELIVRGFSNFSFGPSLWSVASLVPALMLIAVAIRARDAHPAFLSTTAILALAVCYGCVPSAVSPVWANFNTRFLPFLWLALLVRVPAHLPRRLVGLLVCASVAGSAASGGWMLRRSGDIEEFRSGLPYVEKGARLLPILFSVKSPGDNIEPFIHAWAYYTMEAGTGADMIWASRSVDAVHYRVAPPPRFHHDYIQNSPRTMFSAERWCATLMRGATFVPEDCTRSWEEAWRSYLRGARERFSQVLIWDPPTQALALIEETYSIVYRQGRLLIGKRRELAEAASKEGCDGRTSIGFEKARAGAAEERLANQRFAGTFPGFAVPAEPSGTDLIEDIHRPIEQLGVLGSDTCATGDGVVRVDFSDHEDLLPVVDLVPNGLQHLAEHGCVRVLPVHELAEVAQAHIAVAQLCLGQDAQAALTGVGMPFESEVHLVDAGALCRRAKFRLSAIGRAAKTNAVLALHVRSFLFDLGSLGTA